MCVYLTSSIKTFPFQLSYLAVGLANLAPKFTEIALCKAIVEMSNGSLFCCKPADDDELDELDELATELLCAASAGAEVAAGASLALLEKLELELEMELLAAAAEAEELLLPDSDPAAEFEEAITVTPIAAAVVVVAPTNGAFVNVAESIDTLLELLDSACTGAFAGGVPPAITVTALPTTVCMVVAADAGGALILPMS